MPKDFDFRPSVRRKCFTCPWALSFTVLVNWVWNAPWKAISILNFLWWYILRWVSNVFILPSVPGSCHDYSSIAHTHLQVHGNPYQKEDFITIWVTQPVQRFYPKKMMQRSDHEIQINPLGFSMHFSIEEKRNIFILFTNWNSSVWSRSKPKCCLPSYIWWGKKKKSLTNCTLCGKSVLMESLQ